MKNPADTPGFDTEQLNARVYAAAWAIALKRMAGEDPDEDWTPFAENWNDLPYDAKVALILEAQNVPAPALLFLYRPQPHTDREREMNWGDDTVYIDYGILMPVDRFDIRSNVYNPETDEEEIALIRYQYHKFGTTASTGAHRTYGSQDTPFRDGVHAMHDSIKLGDLPIWIMYADGRVEENTKAYDNFDQIKEQLAKRVAEED